jgi:hypothetical protein
MVGLFNMNNIKNITAINTRFGFLEKLFEQEGFKINTFSFEPIKQSKTALNSLLK